MRWRLMPLMMLFVAMAHFNRISITVAGADEIISDDFISEKQMGFVYDAFLVMYTLCMTPGGWFIDRFGPRRAWIIVSLGLASFAALTGVAGLLVTAPVALFAVLLVVRSLMGVTNAPLHPTGARLVANWLPPSRANLGNGLLNGAALVGIASTYILFGMLIDRFGWPGAFLVSAVISLGLYLLWSTVASDYPPGTVATSTPHSQPSTHTGQFWGMLKNRPLLLLTISYALVGYFQYLFFYWAQYYFKNDLDFSKPTSRMYSSLLTVTMGVGMVIGGWLSDRSMLRFGSRRGLAVMPILGLLLSAAAVGLALVVADPMAVVICLAIAMGAVGLSEGSHWTGAVMVGGQRAGTAAAILNTGGNAGGLLAPVLTPYIKDFWGWPAALAAAAIVSILAALLWFWIDPTEQVAHT